MYMYIDEKVETDSTMTTPRKARLCEIYKLMKKKEK